jgi:glycosyl hydrolase family 43
VRDAVRDAVRRPTEWARDTLRRRTQQTDDDGHVGVRHDADADARTDGYGPADADADSHVGVSDAAPGHSDSGDASRVDGAGDADIGDRGGGRSDGDLDVPAPPWPGVGALPGLRVRLAALVRSLPVRSQRVVAQWQSRRRLIATVLVLLVVATYGFAYRSARAGLAEHREQLASTRSRLSDTRDELATTRDDKAATDERIVQARADITAAVDQRTFIDTVIQQTWTEIANVEELLEAVNTSRYLVGAHSGTVQSCLDAVAVATRASRNGDAAGAVAALRGASGECAETLAYASGASFAYDFPDPFVLRAGGSYYAYSTISGAGDIQVIRSSDLVHWELVGNALPELPSWASGNLTWAPAVLARGGSYVAYYTVHDRNSRRQCISRAVSSSPAGPFVDDSAGPMVCGFTGAIDPSPFVDASGRAFLLWKSERMFDVGTLLWSQELTADGRGLVGAPHQLMGADRGFEHGVVEAPSMVQAGGRYILLYAAGRWSARTYSTAYAVCAGPTGPCLKPPDGRILRSGPHLAAPGGAEAFRSADGFAYVAFHAYAEPRVGYPSNRYLHVARLSVSGNRVSIDAET